jgi:hypothetical protein
MKKNLRHSSIHERRSSVTGVERRKVVAFMAARHSKQVNCFFISGRSGGNDRDRGYVSCTFRFFRQGILGLVINSPDGIYPLLFDRGHNGRIVCRSHCNPIYKRYTG